VQEVPEYRLCTLKKDLEKIQGFVAVFRIRIHMFVGLPDPDPFVSGMDPDPDPDPSISKQK
jgi:hypothetical protein